MGRKHTVDQETLIRELRTTFRKFGYEGAALSELERATGLKKASLYHRFPGGKDEMAREVLRVTEAQLRESFEQAVPAAAPIAEQVAGLKGFLGAYYSQGQTACLLNTLTYPHGGEALFADEVRSLLQVLLDLVAQIPLRGDSSPEDAAARARQAVMLLEGGLVVSQAMGSAEPFKEALELAGGLLGAPAHKS
ncbi:MAG: TetR/AcrR family transcriptional regulator [Verrucomicrobiota bacterium JB022]|nr:TetR/AcrR family transcriptional regulator [Verrucomicrobiota bacterium JB022]